jgi:hypothetical protein
MALYRASFAGRDEHPDAPEPLFDLSTQRQD